MYLSRIMLSFQSRSVRGLASDVYELHRFVMKGFPESLPEGERVLFRLEPLTQDGILTLLVQSQTEPDWSPLLEMPDALLPSDEFAGWENPAVKPLQVSLEEGQLLRFRMRVNPTVKKKQPGRKQGKRCPLLREEEQQAWLQRKAASGGFVVRAAHIQNPMRLSGIKNGNRNIQLHTVLIDGVLEVSAPDSFQETLASGLGSAKGFGCGMLSITRFREAPM